ncbi:MAG: efflux RND transporter periplasmic adaptor subunit, partial [Chitinophagaceae bacterium]
LLLTGCFATDKDKVKKEEAPILPVITLVEEDTILDNNYVASIQAIKNVEVRAKISGSLEKILCDEGRIVKKGQPLFKLNDRVFQVELERAKANLENMRAEAHVAELEIKRVKLLVDKKVITKTELDLAEAKLQSARARVKEAATAESQANINLDFATIRAPFDGITNRIPLKPGSFINTGDLLTSVSDLNSIYAYFDVSEIEYLHYIKTREKSGSKYSDVTLILADGTEYDQPGKIETMEGEMDNSTGSIAFRARFDNPKRILKHGSSGKVTLTTNMHKAVLVPQKAVFEVQDKNYVFLLNPDQTVTMQSFEPLTKIAQSYVVRSGLKAGDQIVYEGIQNIKHGTKIQPKQVPTDSLIVKN